MSTFENKIANLKDQLEAVNIHIISYSDTLNYYINAADDIKAEIKKLEEEAKAPKQGDVYQNSKSAQNYMVARVDHLKYGLINLATGERFRDPASSIEGAFGHYPELFVKVER